MLWKNPNSTGAEITFWYRQKQSTLVARKKYLSVITSAFFPVRSLPTRGPIEANLGRLSAQPPEARKSSLLPVLHWVSDSSPPAACQAPPASGSASLPSFLLRPGQPRPGGRLRTHARGLLALLPNARAAHAHCAPAVSVCLNRKADILVPLSPPRPTPQAIASATRPFPSSGRGPSQKLPHQQPQGPSGRLPHRPAPASLPRDSLGPPTSPCPAGPRHPSSDRIKWESEPVCGDQLLAKDKSVRLAGPSGTGDAGLDTR